MMLKTRLVVPEVTRTRYPRVQDTPSNTAREKLMRNIFLKDEGLVLISKPRQVGEYKLFSHIRSFHRNNKEEIYKEKTLFQELNLKHTRSYEVIRSTQTYFILFSQNIATLKYYNFPLKLLQLYSQKKYNGKQFFLKHYLFQKGSKIMI